jgi:hypothetical protein
MTDSGLIEFASVASPLLVILRAILIDVEATLKLLKPVIQVLAALKLAIKKLFGKK